MAFAPPPGSMVKKALCNVIDAHLKVTKGNVLALLWPLDLPAVEAEIGGLA